MATAKQIEAAKKALADGLGIGAAIDAAEAEAWEKIENAPKKVELLLFTELGQMKPATDVNEDDDYQDFIDDDLNGIYATHYRLLPQPPKMED